MSEPAAHQDEYHDALVDMLELIWGRGFMIPDGPRNARRTVAGLDLRNRKVLDIGSGIDHLRNLAEDHPLNLGQVVVMGHSAGGHLALWAGARPKILVRHDLYQADPLPLAGVVALAPAAALTKLHQQDVCDKVIDRLMDGSPAERPDRYAYVEPARMAPIGVPQTLLMGVYDTNWTPHGEEYYTAARAIGDNMMRRVMAPEAGHFEVINPSSTTWPLVLEAVRSHLQ